MITLNPHTLTITDTATCTIYQMTTLADLMAKHRELSLAAKGPSVTSARKQRRLDQIAEQRQAGR